MKQEFSKGKIGELEEEKNYASHKICWACSEKPGIQHSGSQIKEGTAWREDASCSQNTFRDSAKAGVAEKVLLSLHHGDEEPYGMVFHPGKCGMSCREKVAWLGFSLFVCLFVS